MLELNHSVDLISLDQQDPFARYLVERGELYQVAWKNYFWTRWTRKEIH